MSLNGTAWAEKAAAFATYVEGDSALELAPAAGGSAITFSLDQRTYGYDETEGQPVKVERLGIMVRGQLTAFALYTYDSHTWTCESVTEYRAGGAAWPYYATLVRHV